MQNYVILVFFRKQFISKDMKAIIYKMKKLNRFVNSSKRSPRDLQLSRICLTSTKKNDKYDKNQKFIYIFLWKTLDFVTPIPFDTFPWNVSNDLSLTNLGNN